MLTDITYADVKKIEEQLFLASSATADDIAKCFTAAEVEPFLNRLCALNEIQRKRISMDSMDE